MEYFDADNELTWKVVEDALEAGTNLEAFIPEQFRTKEIPQSPLGQIHEVCLGGRKNPIVYWIDLSMWDAKLCDR